MPYDDPHGPLTPPVVTIDVDGDPYAQLADAAGILAEGTTLTPVQAAQRLARWGREGRVRRAMLHSRLAAYNVADVLALRAALIDG